MEDIIPQKIATESTEKHGLFFREIEVLHDMKLVVDNRRLEKTTGTIKITETK